MQCTKCLAGSACPTSTDNIVLYCPLGTFSLDASTVRRIIVTIHFSIVIIYTHSTSAIIYYNVEMLKIAIKTVELMEEKKIG